MRRNELHLMISGVKFNNGVLTACALLSGACFIVATTARGDDRAAATRSAPTLTGDATKVELQSKDAKQDTPRRRRDLPWVSAARKRQLEADSYLIALRAGKTPDEPKSQTSEAAEKEFLADGTKSVAENTAATYKPELSDENASARKKSVFAKFMGDWQPELSADKFSYADDGSGRLIGLGHAKVSHKNFELNSDRFEFAQDTGKSSATGDVRVSLGEIRVISENLFVDMAKSEFNTSDARFGTPPAYAATSGVEGDKKKITAKDTHIWFGDPSWASLNVSAASASYDEEADYLELEDVTFSAGGIPFFYVPSYAQHGLKKPPFDIWNRLGYNSDLGFAFANTLFYNGLGDVSPGLLLDYYTKRSVLFGPAVKYEISNAETWLKGVAQGAYINDHGSPSVLGTDSLGKPIGQDRFFINVRHAQTLGDNATFVANVDYWSDEFVTRDFRENLFYDNQTPDNFAEANYYGSFYTASVFTRFAPNSWETVQQRLPEVRFDMHPVQILKTGIYQTGFASYSMLRDSTATPFGTDYLNSNRLDAYYGLTRPISLTSWSSFTPVVGARVTYYGNALGDSSDYVRALGQIGFDTQMDVYGTFDFKSETLGLDGVRHHMTPFISYRYIPKASQGSGRIPDVDDYYYFNPYPSILDLGSLRNVDRLYNTNTMRFGIRNVFETRDEEYGSREIARLDLFQDVNFDEQPVMNSDGLQSYSDFYVNASVSPSRWLTVGSYARINPNEIDVPEINFYLSMYEGDEFSVWLASTYLQGFITQYWAYAEYKISEDYKLAGRWAYDYRLSMFTDQTYALQTRVSNSYIIEYRISYRQGSTRQNDFTFGVRFTVNLD